MEEFLVGHGREFNEVTAPVSEFTQLVLEANVVGEGRRFEDKLEDEHRKPKEDEKDENPCAHRKIKDADAAAIHVPYRSLSPSAVAPNPNVSHSSADSWHALMSSTHM